MGSYSVSSPNLLTIATPRVKGGRKKCGQQVNVAKETTNPGLKPVIHDLGLAKGWHQWPSLPFLEGLHLQKFWLGGLAQDPVLTFRMGCSVWNPHPIL